MNRRTLLWSLAFAAGGGALWRYRDWLPVRGLFNPCHVPRLPDEIAAHPAILRATQDLDLSKVWDCHVHLVGTGDSEPGEVWVNPALDSIRHPLQLVQKRLYMNASCVSDQQDGDAAYVDRLQALMEPKTGMRLLLMAFDYNYDEAGRRRPELSTFFISNRYAQAVAASHPQWEWICSVHPYRDDAVDALQWAAEHGARAVKWLPPAMGMDPSSPRCDPFYAAMQTPEPATFDPWRARAGGPRAAGIRISVILCFCGGALDHGVRVIVAHCASLGTAIDSRRSRRNRKRQRSNFQAFMEMMRDPAYQDLLYGDASAITQINRAPKALKTLLLADDIHHRLLNGSDYPLTGILPLFSQSQLQALGLIEPRAASVIFEVQKYNPLLFDLALKRNLEWQGRRFPRQVFETARFFEQTA